jgi:dTDP-glucose 4,6-dehydratase
VAQTVVAGGAGFLGSHLCELLLARGDEVVCVDNLLTGEAGNVAHLLGRDDFTFVEHDVTLPLDVAGAVHAVMNLASPASPRDYLGLPIETLDVGSAGTRNLLELAREKEAVFFMASTSEVYGDPEVHPQAEDYWGHVNPVGPRSVYDEAKRFSEALTMAYHRTHGVDVRIARIFNSYGPRLRAGDGRVVSNFVVQALAGRPITVYGDGAQTRSFCYVDDEVAGLVGLLDSGYVGPVNVGNPDEFTISELAELVIDVTGSPSEIVHEPLPQDDPAQRQPDITKAKELFGWAPEVKLREGLERTAAWFREAGGG